jgi:hypothetical protein
LGDDSLAAGFDSVVDFDSVVGLASPAGFSAPSPAGFSPALDVPFGA